MREQILRILEKNSRIGVDELAIRIGAEEIAVIAHGGVQMAVMDCWGIPRGSYYSWQTPCGEGLLLDASGWPVELRFLGRESFHS